MPDPKAPTRKRIAAMVSADPQLKPREIAAALGISTQRVYQHLKALEDERASA